MALGCQLNVIQSGSVMSNVPLEQVYADAQVNSAATIIVSMTIPNLQGVTAVPTAGTFVIDSFKTMLRHQNTHALTNAAFVLQMSGSGVGATVASARVFVGGVTKELARCTATETALVGHALNQATLTAAQTALTTDIDTAGAATYYGTTDAYRRQLAASCLYKVLGAASVLPLQPDHSPSARVLYCHASCSCVRNRRCLLARRRERLATCGRCRRSCSATRVMRTRSRCPPRL
jgi:xanthine dehydrogenase iron-sulfur cluster and FAD-binding subunit A